MALGKIKMHKLEDFWGTVNKQYMYYLYSPGNHQHNLKNSLKNSFRVVFSCSFELPLFHSSPHSPSANSSLGHHWFALCPSKFSCSRYVFVCFLSPRILILRFTHAVTYQFLYQSWIFHDSWIVHEYLDYFCLGCYSTVVNTRHKSL